MFTYVLDAQKDQLIETVLLSTICEMEKKRTQEYQVSVLAGSAVGRRLSKLLSTRRIGVCDQVTLKSAISAKSTSKILQIFIWQLSH